MHPIPLQFASPLGVVFTAVTVLLNPLVIFTVLGGLGFFSLRFQSDGGVDERLDRMERKIGRLDTGRATGGVRRSGPVVF